MSAGARILVMDMNQTYENMLRAYLRGHGFKVSTAADGQLERCWMLKG